MSMTKIRKKAQDILRRKYKYSTSDNRGRGTILYKANLEPRHHMDGYNFVCDLEIVMDNNISWHPNSPIEVNITKYRDNGEDAPKDKRYEKIVTNGISLTFEELELIHTIACQMAEENDWNGQTKRHKANKRKKS